MGTSVTQSRLREGKNEREAEKLKQSQHQKESMHTQEESDRPFWDCCKPYNPKQNIGASRIENKLASSKQILPAKGSTTSIVLQPETPIKNVSFSGVKQSQRRNSIEQVRKVIQFNDSRIYYKSERAVEVETAISAVRIKGLKKEQYQGKKVKRFQILADIPERNLIKQSNYFDESNSSIGLKPEISITYADFRTEDPNQFRTPTTKTYLYRNHLSEKVVQ